MAAYSVWGFFFIGIAFHVLLRAGYAVRSKVNITKDRWTFLKTQWDTIAVRTFLNSLIFAFLSTHPTAITDIVSYFHVNLDFNLSVNNFTASVFGFFVDTFLDSVQNIVASIPQLSWVNTVIRGQIPGYDPTVVNLANGNKDKV